MPGSLYGNMVGFAVCVSVFGWWVFLLVVFVVVFVSLCCVLVCYGLFFSILVLTGC